MYIDILYILPAIYLSLFCIAISVAQAHNDFPSPSAAAPVSPPAPALRQDAVTHGPRLERVEFLSAYGAAVPKPPADCFYHVATAILKGLVRQMCAKPSGLLFLQNLFDFKTAHNIKNAILFAILLRIVFFSSMCLS